MANNSGLANKPISYHLEPEVRVATKKARYDNTVPSFPDLKLGDLDGTRTHGLLRDREAC